MTKIAIIEDDQLISQMYRMKFEEEGFEVEIAADGRNGVAMVAKTKPDLILLDLWMPELDGISALKLIRELPGGADLPVIVLTNSGGAEDETKLRQIGIQDYVVKADFTPREVVAKIKTVLDRPPKAA
jgi:DNA-binding response OmpR family regulator